MNVGCQHSLKNDLTHYYIFAIIWVYFFYLCGKISPFSECQHASLLCGCFGASVLHLYALECLNDSSNHHNYHPWLTHQFTVTSWKASAGGDTQHTVWLYKMYTRLYVYKNPSSDWHQLWNHETVWNDNRAQAFSPGWAEIRWCVVLSSGVTVEISSDSSDLPAK